MTLTAEEKEIVVTIADDEKSWHVFTDSKRALSAKLLQVARRWGVEPIPVGEGFQFDLPLKALSVRVPRKATAGNVTNLRHKRVSGPTAPGVSGFSGTPAPDTPCATPPVDGTP
jgi:hypothetical protein